MTTCRFGLKHSVCSPVTTSRALVTLCVSRYMSEVPLWFVAGNVTTQCHRGCHSQKERVPALTIDQIKYSLIADVDVHQCLLVSQVQPDDRIGARAAAH
jgi:hypothetical protein